MTNRITLVIIVISIYLIALFISGFLAYFYHIKHKPYVELNEDFRKEVMNAYQRFDFNSVLTPIDNIFKTKEGEDIYLVNKSYVDIGQKNKKQIKKSTIDLQNNIYGVMKNNYTLISKNEKEFFELKIIYLSNKRVVFKNGETFKIVKLSDLLICQFTILNNHSNLDKILLLETSEECFKIIVKDLQLGFLITKFLKKG